MAVSLEDIFREFCSFGDKDAAPLMDGAKFAKMCRDMKLLDKKVTATEVDIIFARAKPKTERKMTLGQFEAAIDMLAEKKYPGDPDGVRKIRTKLTSGAGPTTHGATRVAGNEVLERMTDTSKYTGTHKHRFDVAGHGKGLEGRDSVAKGPGHIPPLVSAQTSYVTGCQIGEDAVDSARSQHSPKTRSKVAASRSSQSPRSSPLVGSSKTTAPAKSSPRTQPKVASSVAKASPKTQSRSTSSPKPLPKASSASTSSPKPQTKAASVSTSSPKTKPKGDIYDRLTDSSKYTGTHKHRFDETGRGKGMYGRDTPSKGPAMSPGSASGLSSYVTGYKHENTYGK